MREPEPLQPEDLFEIERQDSQVMWLGTSGDVTQESAQVLASQDIAWTARRDDGSILACFGISDLFPGTHGVAWALLSQPLGADHLALTRFVQNVVAGAPHRRLELLACSADVPEGSLDPVSAAMADPTPECRWAALIGFGAAHVLRNFGGASETYMLFERIDGEAAGRGF